MAVRRMTILRGGAHEFFFDTSRISGPRTHGGGGHTHQPARVRDGLCAATPAPRYKVNSNAAVIVTNDGVIVVDSHSKPSAAYALYREIQAITRQPIKKIINTHFHWDHWQGNQVYAEANPGLEILSSQRTLENITDPDAGGGGLPYIEN